MIALIATLAVLADLLLGEPRRAHPLVGFGRTAQHIERALHGGTDRTATLRGVLALMLAVIPPTALCAALLALLGEMPAVVAAIEIAVLCFVLGHRSLREHAGAVRSALRLADLPLACRRVGDMVSRDTGEMDGPRIVAATVESVLENGSDAVFGALFWFAVAGAPGALAYRLVNTLDAMWGYRTPRYQHFGWAAARLDDGLNWVPARLTALSYALLGSSRSAWHCWRSQAPLWDSPNGGPVMAAGAGALQIRLGGTATYHGISKTRPALGMGAEPGIADIERSLRLVSHGLLLWLAALWLISLGLAVVIDA